MLTKFLIVPILSTILAPPNITTKGLSGSFIIGSKLSNSFKTKKPRQDSFIYLLIPTFEA